MLRHRVLHALCHEQVLHRFYHEQGQEGPQYLFETYSGHYGQEEEGSDQRQHLGI